MWHAHLARDFTGGTPVPLFCFEVLRQKNRSAYAAPSGESQEVSSVTECHYSSGCDVRHFQNNLSQ